MESQNAARERRRSSISLAIPVCAHPMAASVEIGQDEVEFEAHGVRIDQDGLFIDGSNVSGIHQNDLRVLSELGRGACSVVKLAQVGWEAWRDGAVFCLYKIVGLLLALSLFQNSPTTNHKILLFFPRRTTRCGVGALSTPQHLREPWSTHGSLHCSTCRSRGGGSFPAQRGCGNPVGSQELPQKQCGRI